MRGFPCWVVFYHYLRDRDDADGRGIRALTTQDFATQLDWLATQAEIIDYPAFARAVRDRRGFERPSVLLTFDDGLTDHLQVAFTELSRRRLSGVFFVNGDPLADRPRLVNVHRTHLLLDRLGPDGLLREVHDLVDRALIAAATSSDLYRYDGQPEQVIKRLLNYELPYSESDRVLSELSERHLGDQDALASSFYLSRADVRQMAGAGMTFGYHTRRHRVLSRLDAIGQRDELAGGVALVQTLTGQSAVPFCYPYGHRQTFNTVTTGLLAELGYDMAFTTVREPARPDRVERFAIPRFDTVDLAPRGAVPIEAATGTC